MITVVTVYKDRPIPETIKYLESVKDQLLPSRLIIVDYGSTEENHRIMSGLSFKYKFELVRVVNGVEVFNQGRALNIGYKMARTPQVVSTDIDIILSRGMLLHTKNILEKQHAMVLCQRIDLGKKGENLGLHSKSAVGPYIGMSTNWIKRVRGIDEFYTNWGKWDDDIRDRAIQDGLEIIWLNEVYPVNMFHQWHAPSNRTSTKKNIDYLKKKNKPIIRNPEKWGEL